MVAYQKCGFNMSAECNNCGRRVFREHGFLFADVVLNCLLRSVSYLPAWRE